MLYFKRALNCFGLSLCKVFALPVGGGFARFRFRYGGEEKSLALGHKCRAEAWFTVYPLLVGLGDRSCDGDDSAVNTFFLGG